MTPATRRLVLVYGTACGLSFLAFWIGLAVIIWQAHQHHHPQGSLGMDSTLSPPPQEEAIASQLWMQLRQQLIVEVEATSPSAAAMTNDTQDWLVLTSQPTSPQARALRWLVFQQQQQQQQQQPSVSSSSSSLSSLSPSQLPLAQRYALAVLYYHWSGSLWQLRPSDGWLRTPQDQQVQQQQAILQNQSQAFEPSTLAPTGTATDDSLSSSSSSSSSSSAFPPSYIPTSSLPSATTTTTTNTSTSNDPIPINECWWIGVTCNANHTSILGLNFTAPQFLGHFVNTRLPAEMGLLTHLQQVIIPQQLLVGTVPSAWQTLTDLQYLDLTINHLSGFGPALLSHWTSLQHLLLNSNQFTSLSLSSLQYLTNLVDLDLRNNPNLVIVPDNRATTPTSTTTSNDNNYNNNTSTPFWDSLASWPQLTSIAISYTRIASRLPNDLNVLTDLQYLEADQVPFYGTFPTTLGSLTALTSISLQQPINGVSSGAVTPAALGRLPTELSQLTQLQYLSLQAAGVTGTILTELGHLTRLAYLDVSYNTDLHGTLPTQLGTMEDLQFFNIQATSISGTVPATLANATRLNNLELAYTKLTGTIPTDLCLPHRWWLRFEADCAMVPGVKVDTIVCDCCTQCFGQQ